jgi:hypothetical protein
VCHFGPCVTGRALKRRNLRLLSEQFPHQRWVRRGLYTVSIACDMLACVFACLPVLKLLHVYPHPIGISRGAFRVMLLTRSRNQRCKSRVAVPPLSGIRGVSPLQRSCPVLNGRHRTPAISDSSTVSQNPGPAFEFRSACAHAIMISRLAELVFKLRSCALCGPTGATGTVEFSRGCGGAEQNRSSGPGPRSWIERRRRFKTGRGRTRCTGSATEWSRHA